MITSSVNDSGNTVHRDKSTGQVVGVTLSKESLFGDSLKRTNVSHRNVYYKGATKTFGGYSEHVVQSVSGSMDDFSFDLGGKESLLSGDDSWFGRKGPEEDLRSRQSEYGTAADTISYTMPTSFGTSVTFQASSDASQEELRAKYTEEITEHADVIFTSEEGAFSERKNPSHPSQVRKRELETQIAQVKLDLRIDAKNAAAHAKSQQLLAEKSIKETAAEFSRREIYREGAVTSADIQRYLPQQWHSKKRTKQTLSTARRPA